MKTILYIRAMSVGFIALFTRENIKQMLIGSLIGQVIGWAFVAGLFLTGCSKREPMTFSDMRPPAPVCIVPSELTAELEVLTQEADALQAEMDQLAAEIQAETNDKKIEKLQEEHECVMIELLLAKMDIVELQHQINSYDCKAD